MPRTMRLWSFPKIGNDPEAHGACASCAFLAKNACCVKRAKGKSKRERKDEKEKKIRK
ncbi:MAG: hypothetical protein HQL86_04575 [Magnetococcales bacterium]|nr:hypothetical protein [Magnetococcales bacterium]